MDCNTYPHTHFEMECLIDDVLNFVDVEFDFSLLFGNLHKGDSPHHVSPAPIFLFFERRGLLSSRLFQGDEISILFFFRFRAHTQQTIKKSVFRLGRPEIGFRNFVSSPSLPLSFIRLPPRTEAPKILSLTNE